VGRRVRGRDPRGPGSRALGGGRSIRWSP
jgi:hypothetical protein